MDVRVLIIDDSEFMQIMLQNILKKSEFKVIGIAEDGIDGIEKYAQLKPDLVTLDINMPHLNGLEVLDRIYKLDPEAKIVIVSSCMEFQSSSSLSPMGRGLG
ncbi:MAG: response regulator [Candidatus Omnitrophota bacterium]|nr:response regulator [Candidatus Omnitrophota bacterium]